MCGRISQKNDLADYIETMRWNPAKLFVNTEGPRFNVPPGTRPLALHRLGSGDPHADRLFWGYKPTWSKRPPVINARLDTVLKGSRFWSRLLTKRVIVPADGWFEWVGSKGDKQPWFISARDQKPILIAGITAWQPGRDVVAETGFAIITDDAAGGMVDLHDRRPVCLTAESAQAWVNPEASVSEALDQLSTSRPESAFHWWMVTRQMGNSRYQLPDANQRITL